MPSMWELPELQPASNGAKVAFTLRHSITVTDYVVRVTHHRFPESRAGKWVPLEAIARPALDRAGQENTESREGHVIR